MITPDEILHRPECLDEVDPRALFALATKFQSAASICFRRAVAGLSSTAPATTERAPKPESDRLISMKDAALRINKHRSWMDRHGRRLGIVVCDPTTGRALGCSTHAIERFLGKRAALVEQALAHAVSAADAAAPQHFQGGK